MSHWTIHRGTEEYRTATVKADATLDDQTVEMTLDHGTTWIDAEWVGTAGTTRKARIFITPDNTPSGRSGAVEIRITDNPEIPWFKAGTYTIT